MSFFLFQLTFLKTDFDRWRDEDEEEEESAGGGPEDGPGGFDMSQFVRHFFFLRFFSILLLTCVVCVQGNFGGGAGGFPGGFPGGAGGFPGGFPGGAGGFPGGAGGDFDDEDEGGILSPFHLALRIVFKILFPFSFLLFRDARG